MEHKVLSALLTNRAAYEKIKAVCSKEDFSEQGEIIYSGIAKFYDVDPDANQVDVDILLSRLERDYPKHIDRLANVVKRLEPCSELNVIQEYIELRRERAATELASALLTKDTGKRETFLEEYQKWSEAQALDEEEKIIEGIRLDELAQHASRKNLIQVYPAALNELLEGGLPKESHILIYAPPEVGKSLFSINMACGFLFQNKRVLYIGNEDPYSQMLFRFYSCLTGMDKHQLLADIDKGQRVADDRGFNNLIFIPQEGGTIKKLDAQIKKYKPDIVFIDQIGNFTVPQKEGVQALEEISRGIRGLLKRYEIIGVSVHQGAAEAQGKLYLDLGDVYFSNVGVQAQMDVMLGIGATKPMLETGQRMISPTKNKITGIHEPFECQFIPKLSRVM